ncbi:hypothetical protein GCM10027592_26690 [Spirosoma flavus]
MALMLGIVLYDQLPHVYQLPLIAFFVGAGLLFLGLTRNKGKVIKPIRIESGVGAMLLLLAIGWSITWQCTASNRSDNIVHLTDTLRAYEGVVAAQPEARAKTFRVELELYRGKWSESSQSERSEASHWQPLSGRVIVYLDKADQPMPRYGEVWLVASAPRPIDPPLNPGEFNYKRYLSYRNIYHQQYLRPFQRKVLRVEPPNRITQLATFVNRWADDTFIKQIGSRPEFGIVNAMILGVRDDLDTELYRAYSAAGAVHILSVSGLHVGILFNVLTILLGFLAKNRRSKLLMAGIQLAILWFYALVTGFSPPVLRSAAMFTLLIVARALGRPQQLLNTLGASTFFILCFDPYALFSAGFQLSCLAVGGIVAWEASLYQSITFQSKWFDKLWKLTAVALVAQLITFPLGVFYFHQFPTYFLLANPAVMLISGILLPLAMATLGLSWVPYVNNCLGWLLQKVAWLLNYVVMQTGNIPGATWDGLWLSPVAMVLIYVFILSAIALVMTRSKSYVWATCLTAILLAGVNIWNEYQQTYQRKLAVHFLPHRTAVSLTDGHKSLLLTDLDSTDTRSFDFYLKNTFGQWGISDLTRADVRNALLPSVSAYYRTDEYALWVWKGKTLLIVNKFSASEWHLPAVVDYLIIRRNALRNWNQLNGRVVARQIIFDDSNKTPLTDKLLAEAKENSIACYSVRQMGAYVTELE